MYSLAHNKHTTKLIYNFVFFRHKTAPLYFLFLPYLIIIIYYHNNTQPLRSQHISAFSPKMCKKNKALETKDFPDKRYKIISLRTFNPVL